MSDLCDDRDRESILRDLESSDEEVRRLAVERVGAIGVEDSIPVLIEALGDPSWRVRKASVERFAACPDITLAADALIPELAEEDDPGRRNAAVEALIRCGSKAVPLVVDAIGTNDPDVRKLTVDILAAIGDSQALPHLLCLIEDPDPNVRAAIAEALGAIGGDGVDRALHRLATDSEEVPPVRFAALHALFLLGEPIPVSELGAVLDDPTLCPAALLLLGCPDDGEAVPTLLKALAERSRSAREAAIRSLLILVARSDGAGCEELFEKIRQAADESPVLVTSAVQRLANADLATRLILVQFLGLLRTPEVVGPILRAGNDDALVDVCLATLEAMGSLAAETLDAAWNDLERESRRNACLLLGRIDGGRGSPRLMEALEDVDPEVRIAAARSVGERAEAVPVLMGRLETAAREYEFDCGAEVIAASEALIALSERASLADELVELLRSRFQGAPDRVRRALAGVLGRIARVSDLPLIEILLGDSDAGVRRAAVGAVGRLDPAAATETLRSALGDESATVRAAVARVLGSCPSEAALAGLRHLAGDEDPWVRAAAIRAAGGRYSRSEESGREIVLALIEAGLADDAVVAIAAVAALKQVGGPVAERAAEVLERGEPELISEATGCLAAHAASDRLGAVIGLVSHPDWSVRAEAIRTLADRGVTQSVPAILRRMHTERDEFVRGEMLRALTRLES